MTYFCIQITLKNKLIMVDTRYTKKDIKKHIDKLEHLLDSDASYYTIRKTLSAFKWALFVEPNFTTGCIKRVRIYDGLSTESMKEGMYKEFKEIHHRTDVDNITKFDRFNAPHENRFYASSLDLLAYCEVSENFRENKSIKYKTATTGGWVLNEEILVAIIVSPYTDYGKNEMLIKCQNILKEKNYEEYYELFHYLTEKTITPMKNEKDYYITSAFANYVFNTKWEHPNYSSVDCIVYPSGLPADMYKQRSAVNFCFRPEIVNKKLILNEVLCQRMETTKFKTSTNHYSISKIKPKQIDHSKKMIIWE